MSLANSLSQTGKMNELAALSSQIFKLCRVEVLCAIRGAWKTCEVSRVSASQVFVHVWVYFSCCWPGCCNFLWHGESYGPASALEPASKHQALTFMWWVCYYFITHISKLWAHSLMWADTHHTCMCHMVHSSYISWYFLEGSSSTY